MSTPLIPHVIYKGHENVDWRNSKVDLGEDDDKLLKHTPKDVVEQLGFDPKKNKGK